MLRKKKTIGFQDLNFTAEIIRTDISPGAVCWSGTPRRALIVSQRCPGPRGGLFVLPGHRDMPLICGGRQNIGKLPKTESGLSNFSKNPITMILHMSEYTAIEIQYKIKTRVLNNTFPLIGIGYSLERFDLKFAPCPQFYYQNLNNALLSHHNIAGRHKTFGSDLWEFSSAL